MKSVIVLFIIFMSHTLIAQEVINLWTDQPPYSMPNSLYAKALTATGQDVEVHFFANGGHGFGPDRFDNGTSQ